MSTTQPPKVVTLSELVARIPDGASIAAGGSFLHRGPFALARELVRQNKRNLEFIKPSPGYDVDLLCRAGAVKKIRPGIVAMEGSSVHPLLAAIMVILAFIGTSLSRHVLERMNDASFRFWTRWTVITLGVFYLASGVLLLLS